MKSRRYIYLILTVGLLLPQLSCNQAGEKEAIMPDVNLSHLNHLYDDVQLPGNIAAGIVHIYSEYPDYIYEIEPNEGYTCVDDVARAMMIDKIRFSDNTEIRDQYNRMARFLLYMQANNGWFHNFVWHDLSINKTWRTSLAEPNWWSWRAFWALSNYSGGDSPLADSIRKACNRLAGNVFETYLDHPKITDTIEGVVVPAWMPLGTAGDQAGLLIMGLEAYYQHIKRDDRALKMIEKLADGILLTQKGDENTFPYGAFMSWQNLWHAYGNLQSYAMLKAGELLKRDDYTESALREINGFYAWLIRENYYANFTLSKQGDDFTVTEKNRFPQIAYGFRPMIWACMTAADNTGEEKYSDFAFRIATWFLGNNAAGQQMYDPATGRCFDGIVSETKVNKNSGAESTVEALLALQVFEKYSKP